MPTSASSLLSATRNPVHGQEVAIVRQDLVLLTVISMEMDYLVLQGENPVRNKVGGFGLSAGRPCPKHNIHQRVSWPWRRQSSVGTVVFLGCAE